MIVHCLFFRFDELRSPVLADPRRQSRPTLGYCAIGWGTVTSLLPSASTSTMGTAETVNIVCPLRAANAVCKYENTINNYIFSLAQVCLVNCVCACVCVYMRGTVSSAKCTGDERVAFFFLASDVFHWLFHARGSFFALSSILFSLQLDAKFIDKKNLAQN